MASLIPNKPEPFTGIRDAVTVSAWLYNIEVYLNLLQVSNPQLVLDEGTRVTYASTFLRDHAEKWWYGLVEAGQVPVDWNTFTARIRNEFIPQDSVQRARDKLRQLRQKSSVLSYLNDFRNVIITIPGISEDEKLDRFVAGLKPNVMLDVRKSRPNTLENAAQVALSVDSALLSTGMYQSNDMGGFSSSPQPMDIGNVEGTSHYRGKSFRPRRRSISKQRMNDLKKNLCFTCHKKGCRPWICNPGDQDVNKMDVDSSGSGSESEN